MYKDKIAFIGLGNMGYPMAGHLMRAGYELRVFNRTRAKAEKWVEQYSGAIRDTPAAAARDADFVMTCVGGDKDLESVTRGKDGAFQTVAKGAIFIDHTTASAQLAKDLAAAAAQGGFEFLDAPLSGGQSGAQNGVLTIMCGGKTEVFEKAKPVLESYARATELIGGTGCGQLAKMVNQICIAGLVQALAEGVHFAQCAELDVDKVIKAISQGAAQSWQMQNRYRTMADGKFDFGFAVDWMRKDLAMVMEEARHNGASLPITQVVDGFYAEVQRLGGNRWDTSSLIKRLE